MKKKNDFVSWDDYSHVLWKIKECSKPPTCILYGYVQTTNLYIIWIRYAVLWDFGPKNHIDFRQKWGTSITEIVPGEVIGYPRIWELKMNMVMTWSKPQKLNGFGMELELDPGNTLWRFNIAIENCPVEIVDLPNYKMGGSFHRFLWTSTRSRFHGMFWWFFTAAFRQAIKSVESWFFCSCLNTSTLSWLGGPGGWKMSFHSKNWWISGFFGWFTRGYLNCQDLERSKHRELKQKQCGCAP